MATAQLTTTITNRSKAHKLLAGNFVNALRLDPGESITLDEEQAAEQRSNPGVAILVASGELAWEGSPKPTPPPARRPPAHDPRIRAQARAEGRAHGVPKSTFEADPAKPAKKVG